MMRTKKHIGILIFCVFYIILCKANNNSNEAITPSDDSINLIFQDSVSIGIRGHYKLEITSTLNPEYEFQSLLQISLYEKRDNSWVNIQNLNDSTLDIPYPDVEISDLNNDGLNGFSYKYVQSGRGYNDVRKHYIFDKRQNRLVGITNSSDYPNLSYNADLNCIESHIGHGGYSTVFFQLEADSLRKFATIEMSDNQRIVSVTNKAGKTTIISQTPYTLDREDTDLLYGDFDYNKFKKYKDR